MIQEWKGWRDEQPETEDDDESDKEIEFMGRIQREILQLCIDLSAND